MPCLRTGLAGACLAIATVPVVACGSNAESSTFDAPPRAGGASGADAEGASVSTGGAGNLDEPGPSACQGDACVCNPGKASCSSGRAKTCRADGSGWDEFDCDPLQGMVCEADGCKGACALPEIGPSYIGCDYYPTVTLNAVWSGFPFAVAVGNASTKVASITITRGATVLAEKEVPASAIEIVELPWVSELKGGDQDACGRPPSPGATRLVPAGAYRLRSDVPVTVYQFSPLTYKIDPPPAECPVGTKCPGGLVAECNSYTNDASLLLPVNALSGNYDAMAWPSTANRAAFLTITAVRDDTRVQVAGRGTFAPGAGIDASGSGEVVLSRGDVLELVSDANTALGVFGADPSGTTIRASAPVQVIAGHSCANVPSATDNYCDHLEEGLFPYETLGNDYLVTHPAAVASTSPHVVRIRAVEPDTHVTFQPDVHEPVTLGPASPPLQIQGALDFRVQADKPLLVAQYMQASTTVESNSGDPAFSLVVPTAQFRNQYVFVASTTYDSNFVNIVAPAGALVTLDGAAVAAEEFSPIGSSGYAVARHELGKSDRHFISSSSGFGVVVYGYGKETSYMYPGGLDLKRIVSPPIR